MKRFLKEAEFALCTYGDLPGELVERIVTYAHHQVPLIATVCRQWRGLLDSYEGWLDLARSNYTRLLLNNPLASTELSFMASFMIDRLADRAEKDKRASRFANYVCFLLDAKLRSLLLLKDNTEEAFYHTHEGCPLFTSLFIYVRTHLCNILTLKNFNKRDVYLNFREVDHLYILLVPGDKDGKPVMHKTVKPDDNEKNTKEVQAGAGWTSQTGFISTLFPIFPRDEVIANMMAKPNWNDPVSNAYYGMVHEEIVQQWEEIAEKASEEGTAMHLNLERYLSEQPYTTDSKEFRLFKAYEAAHVTGKYEPYRTEWTIYDRQTKLCGSIDMLWKPIKTVDHGDGKLHLKMTDWKRCKKIEHYNMYSSGSVSCTSTMGDCNYTHYSIQLCGYTEILEKLENDYNVVIDEMDLGVFHPNQKDFLCIPINRELFKPYFRAIMDYRLTQVMAQ